MYLDYLRYSQKYIIITTLGALACAKADGQTGVAVRKGLAKPSGIYLFPGNRLSSSAPGYVTRRGVIIPRTFGAGIKKQYAVLP